jgi:hypothetical protein
MSLSKSEVAGSNPAGPAKKKSRQLTGFSLFLYLFENDAFAERGIKLRDLDLALYGFLILTSPNDMFGLRGLEF